MTENEKRIRNAALEEAERIAERCRNERETLATNEFMYERSPTAQASLVGKQSEAERIRDAIRVLKSQPRRYLDAEEVRNAVALPLLRAFNTMDVGSYAWGVARDVLDAFRRLGLDIDAARECTCGAPSGDPSKLQAAHYSECLVCEAPAGHPHKMSCRTTEREYATVENGLLPAPRRCNACGHAYHDDNACRGCRAAGVQCVADDS